MDIVTHDTDRFIGNLLASGLLACCTDLVLARVDPRVPGVRVNTPLIHVGFAALVATVLVMLLSWIWRYVHHTDRHIFVDQLNNRAALQGRVMGVVFGLIAGVVFEMNG